MSKHHRVVPYLTVTGGMDAIKFYEEAFDAEEVSRMMADDGRRVMHAELEINDSPLMLSDDFAETGVGAPTEIRATSVTIHLDFKKPKHVDEIIRQALAAGADLVMAPQDVFWGARYGKVRDPFGHVWALHAPLKKKDREKQESDKAN